MNIGAIEEWIGNMELPRGVGAHFAPVKDLLNWLQVNLTLKLQECNFRTNCCSAFLP